MMKVIILSKGRAATHTTYKLFEREGLNYTLVLHTEEEKEEYLHANSLRSALRLSPEKIVVSNAPFGVANQRQWIQENLVEPGEWYICLDDNIREFQAVPEAQYYLPELPVQSKEKEELLRMKDLFDATCTTEEFLKICESMRKEGERVGAFNLGFATVPNFFFRGKKYRYVGYVISKAVIRKNLGIPFETEHQSMEDYAYTAECLLRHGKVLINNFAMPIAGHYEKGGIGTYAERLPQKIVDAEYLMLKYPGLFRHTEKKGSDPKGELAIRFTSTEQVEKWRAFMRGIKNQPPNV